MVVRTTMRGTQRADFFGIPPTGRMVETIGFHIVRIADGRIVEPRGINDDLGLMRHLGAIPTPGEPAGSFR